MPIKKYVSNKGESEIVKLNAYGRIIEVLREDDRWLVFYLGTEGKKRLAQDIFISSGIQQKDVIRYLEDLLHELATSENSHIIIIE